MIDFLRERGMAFFRPDGWSDYYDDLPGGEPRSRCLMAPLYDARALGEWADAADTPAIVTGDFNATPFSWSFRSMLSESGLVNSQDGFGLQTTWPTTNVFLRIPIDHLVHTNDLVTVDRQVMPSFGSDHYPIVVDLALTD